MLKLKSSGGKLDITITDDSLFGTGKKDTAKPHKRHMVTKQSQPKGKQKTKPIAASISDKGSRGRYTNQSKPVKKEVAVKQGNKAKTGQEKKPRPLSVSNVTAVKAGESQTYDAGIISKTHLDNILLLLNSEGISAGKRFSPEHLKYQLMTSLGKNQPTELKGNEEVNVKPVENNIDEERKESRNKSVSSKMGIKDQENENQMYKTVQADAEDKRLQWKRELDEQVLLKKKTKEEKRQENDIEDYNPWGRPGAGAPMRSQPGNLLANYHHSSVRNENITAKETSAASVVWSSHTSSTTVSQSRSSLVTTVATSTSDVKTAVPVAMRSSFAIGAPGLVAHDTQPKRLQEIQWKQELQKQIEEKKERERQRKLKEAQEDFLNLSWNTKHQKPSTQQQCQNFVSPPQHARDMSSQVSEPYEKKPGENMPPQANQDSTMPLPHASLNGGLKSHARGFGMQSMDPQAKEDAEKRRLKMLEHQHAIQEQVEEKRRIKQLEREKRLKDEAIENARFAEEREKLNKAFIMEQKQKRKKEEEAKRISEALQQSVLDAYQASQQAKADKRRKHLVSIGQDARAGATMPRSNVVSQATSEAHHIAPDIVPGIPSDYDKSVQSNYESPQVTVRKTTSTNIGRTSQVSTDRSYGALPRYKETEPVVPPLNLTGRNSPPVPTLRNKMIEKYEFASPKSCSTVSPAATMSNIHRTVRSHSEPCDGSLALSSSKIDTKGRSDVGGNMPQCDKPLSDSRVLKNDVESNRPFSTLEDAFMIPFHRTDSATLPAPKETPEPITSQGLTNISPRGKKGKEVNTQRYSRNAPQKNGKSITPLYRTVSSHLKPERAEPEVSPRRAKVNRNIKARHHSQSTKPTPSHGSVSKTSRMESDNKHLKRPTNTQQRKGKDLEKKAFKAHGTPRNDVPHSSVLSTHQILPEPLQTERQEMILQQLSALRKGLIIKERELKQDTILRF